MSKWKTTQRRSKRLPNSEFGGNLSVHSYGEPASDSSSLSFLDDMLGQTAAPRPPMRRQEVRRDTDARTPPPPQMQVEDIDDILGLVSAPDEERRRDSSSSGFSSRGNRRTERREPEAPISPYEPRPTRSSIRPLSRYGSGGSGGSIGPGSRDHSADPPQFPTRSQRKIERSGKGQPSQETSLDYSPRPHSYVISLRSDGHRSSNADTDDYIDDDNLMPIPVFQVNNDDDDTISCITTSVSSHYDAESRSGSFPWSRRSQKTSSQGEHSYADTLDEIADMLHPNQNGRSNGLSPRVGGNSKTSAGSNEFFRPPPPVQLTSVNGVFGSNPLLVQSDAPTLNADEIYRGTKAPKRQSHNSWMSFEPFLSQTRLLFRYWISRILPRHWRWKGGKDDDGQGYLGTWNSGSDPKMLPSSMQPQARYKYVLVAITLIIVLGRLAILQSPKIKATTMRRIRAVVKKHATKRPIAGIDIHGGMTKRSDGSAVGGSVAGGMARHNVKELNSPPKKHDHSDVELPEAFNVLADVTDLPVRKGVDAPFYWHIPRASGGTVNDIFGGCLSLTLASDAGGSGVAGKENVLEVIKLSKRFSYVNVDTSTPAGIERAKTLDLIGSGLADITVSSLLYHATSLFSDRHKGRLFTIFRHPVERAVSLFHYVQDTQWRRSQTFRKELSELSIDQYFESGLAENNWMTRYLINEPTKGALTKEDLNLAKEILRRKCLVGLLNEKGESFARFERYFGFPLKNDEQKECHDKKLQYAWPQKHRHDEVEENTPLWDLILSHNVYDMELYRYASEVLFVEQGEMFK